MRFQRVRVARKTRNIQAVILGVKARKIGGKVNERKTYTGR